MKRYSLNQLSKAIGGLLNLSTRTRADIAHAVGFLSRKSSLPFKSNWADGKRVMRYIQGILSFGLFTNRLISLFRMFMDSQTRTRVVKVIKVSQ